jgi:hypothetical protein
MRTPVEKLQEYFVELMAFSDKSTQSSEDQVLLAGAMMGAAKMLYSNNLSLQEYNDIMDHNGKKKFPDLSGDGKITKKDILMGRGVIKKAMGGGVDEAINGLKKRGLKNGGLAGRLAQRGYGKARS